MTRHLEIRARVRPSPEPPFDRLYDPLVDDLVRGGPFSCQRFETLWSDGPALRRLAELKRSPLAPELARELLDYHRRLGAAPASLASLELLARGEAVCAVAGQQPAPLGGPLYSLHKTASAVGLSARVTQRTGVPCVPVFWMHGEDSDFAEIRSATLADASLVLHEVTLPSAIHPDGGLLGALPLQPLADLSLQALRHWDSLAFHSEAAALVQSALARARDQGEAYSALMLALFGDRGLVVMEPRLPAFRAAARPLIDRYLARAEALTRAARAAGDVLDQGFARRPLADSALESFVFAIEGGVRRKLTPDEARALPADAVLSPSVALRPALQDGVLPTVAMACGSNEIAYLAQLREVFEGVEVHAASPVPRLSATWLPPAATELIGEAGVQPWELVAGTDQVLRQFAERQVPPDLRAEWESAHRAALAALERFGHRVQAIDASLPQIVESARAKVDYQFARLLEGVNGKVRHKLERQHPQWPRLRYYLMPGDRLQERRLASLEVVAYQGRRVVAELCALAEEGAQRLEDECHEHLVLEL